MNCWRVYSACLSDACATLEIVIVFAECQSIIKQSGEPQQVVWPVEQDGVARANLQFGTFDLGPMCGPRPTARC